mgnify:CR=1 FL=1
MSVIFKQEIIMLLLIIVGILCFKIGIITPNGRKDISSLVLSVVNPIVILLAYQKEFEMRLLKGLIASLVLSAIAFAVAIVVSNLLIRRKDGCETDIERFSAIYSNCGFMGIPLVNALFGSEGVFYLTAFLTVFNLLIWTHGIIQISGVRSLNSLKKALLSPSIISIAIGMIFFLARISLPNIVYQSLDYVAMMNTPLAMLVAGATIAETNVLNAFKNIRIYWITLIKLAIIPLILLAIFRFISVEDTVKLTVITAMSAPTATMCTLFCLRYDKNSKYASEIFAVTTLISTATLPLVIWLAEL